MPEDPGVISAIFLKEGDKNPDIKTQVVNKQQKNYTSAYQYLHECYGFKFAKKTVEADDRRMMSFKGARAEQMVEVGKKTDRTPWIEAGPRPEVSNHLKRNRPTP